MSAGEDAKAAADQAFARGAYPHRVDGSTVDKPSTLDAIAAAMSFPEHFGRNLDALYDMLTDLSWLPRGEHVLIWTGSEALRGAEPKTYLAIRSVLSDAQRALGPGDGRADGWRLTVVLADS
ncbi:barstar family protein [Amycolatopsis jiangsuensis]|uniref:RNAse (Barnase) inhibitor barstar n=1 Tax=Amycolatopsis jiangsuensis TaxID=1181879 RepID=A0A840IN82_9PSEU|nr:barstar family protein [Amycolatopsis jiangsuensis]MBB4682534.1 RNAse (barnase) inhibitor barstar [Amycolatopsis jiangsuensis]